MGGLFTGSIGAAIIRARAGGSASFHLVLVEVALAIAAYTFGVLFLGSNRQMRHEHWTRVKTYVRSVAAVTGRQPAPTRRTA